MNKGVSHYGWNKMKTVLANDDGEVTVQGAC